MPVADNADDRLRLLFTCCHPDLALQDRVALTLKTVSGLSTRDIARLLLVKEQTMSQRLLRTRERITRSGLVLSVPPTDAIGDRVASVLTVIYLVFTEGYSAMRATACVTNWPTRRSPWHSWPPGCYPSTARRMPFGP